jgi:hypothetical protein
VKASARSGSISGAAAVQALPLQTELYIVVRCVFLNLIPLVCFFSDALACREMLKKTLKISCARAARGAIVFTDLRLLATRAGVCTILRLLWLLASV